MANVLDIVLLIGFGAWAYLMAKKKQRDEVGWAMVAAIAFFLPGYAMQEVVFPALVKHYGWSEALQGTWQKPAGFIAGSVVALAVNLYLTFLARALLAPEAPGGGEPPAGEGGPGAAGGGAAGGEGGKSPAAGPPVQQMAIAQPGAPGGAAALDPRALFARFWPVLVPLGLFLAAFLPAATEAIGRGEAIDPGKDPRFFLLVPVVGLFFWRLRGRALEGVVAAVFTLMYVPAIGWMEWRWGRGSSYYSHGYLIPLVVGWLVWMNRRRLATLEAKDDLRGTGLAVLIAGLLLLLVGAFVRAFFVQGTSLVVAAFGLVFFFYGAAISRILLFPLAFIATMIPMPMHLVEKLTFRLKIFASVLSVWLVDLLRVVGIHDNVVVRDGSYIRWETSAEAMDFIIVGDVCSGLRSLIALLAFGALFAYMAKLSLARKLLLFAAAVPISILANMWRIVTLTFIACRWGSEASHGWVHDVTGYGIFAVAFVLFFAFERVLHRFGPDAADPEPPGPQAVAQAAGRA